MSSTVTNTSASATQAPPPEEEGLLSARIATTEPFLTVAIPQYKHRAYLEAVLQSLFTQKASDFEIVVSDDCSPDDSNQVIPSILEKSNRPFRYYTQRANLGYDGNVRFCLRAAAAPYVMLLGNDDALADDNVVTDVIGSLRAMNLPEVAVTNYRQWDSHAVITARVARSRIIGSGPTVALANFRLFSFVSGLVYKRDAALVHETDKWDQSVYYQIYLATRIVASGGKLAGIDCVAVAKDVQIDGKGVPNYATKHANQPWSFKPRDGGLLSVLRVTIDAVEPFLPAEQKSRAIAGAIRQMLMSSYLFWLFEYRRVANWAFAAGLARALRPRHVLEGHSLHPAERIGVVLTYMLSTAIGLLIPRTALKFAKEKAAKLMRARQQRPHG